MKKLTGLLIMLTFVSGLIATTIYDIQYTTNAGDGTYPSPLVDQVVTIEGVVTAVNYRGYADNFYLSMPEGGDWKSIYVYSSGFEPSVGDVIELTGTVTEYYGFTEITNVTDISIIGNDTVPEAIVVETGSLVDPDDAEPYESCLVQIQDVTVVEEQIEFGQWYVDDSTGECQMDDSFFYLDDVDPPIVITVGDTWARLTGILDYSYDEYGINPRTPDDMIDVVHAVNNVVESDEIMIGNVPNPFTSSTKISFNITSKEHKNAEISIYNLKGQSIRQYSVSDNETSITWDGKDNFGKRVNSGIYLYKLKHNGRYTSTKKMILMK